MDPVKGGGLRGQKGFLLCAELSFNYMIFIEKLLKLMTLGLDHPLHGSAVGQSQAVEVEIRSLQMRMQMQMQISYQDNAGGTPAQ